MTKHKRDIIFDCSKFNGHIETSEHSVAQDQSLADLKRWREVAFE
jgi:hypothetical protein